MISFIVSFRKENCIRFNRRWVLGAIKRLKDLQWPVILTGLLRILYWPLHPNNKDATHYVFHAAKLILYASFKICSTQKRANSIEIACFFPPFWARLNFDEIFLSFPTIAGITFSPGQPAFIHCSLCYLHSKCSKLNENLLFCFFVFVFCIFLSFHLLDRPFKLTDAEHSFAFLLISHLKNEK